MTCFTTTQRIMSQHLYSLLCALPNEQRAGAALALASLTIGAEDGFLSLNASGPRVDFFVQCYDVVLSAALALKMLRDDGLIVDTMPEIAGIQEHHQDAETAFNRTERLIAHVPKSLDNIN